MPAYIKMLFGDLVGNESGMKMKCGIAFTVALIYLLVNTAFSDDRWVLRLTEAPRCNECQIIPFGLREMNDFCRECVQPVEEEFRNLGSCKRCYRNTFYCPRCGKTIQDLYKSLKK